MYFPSSTHQRSASEETWRATMASSGGARASGTDGADFKFRQRVDTHYKLMADARSRIRTACRIQQAFAGVLALEQLGAAALEMQILKQSAMLATLVLALLVCAHVGLGTAAAAQQPKGKHANYRVCTYLCVSTAQRSEPTPLSADTPAHAGLSNPTSPPLKRCVSPSQLALLVASIAPALLSQLLPGGLPGVLPPAGGEDLSQELLTATARAGAPHPLPRS